jgi:hypothetical protein
MYQPSSHFAASFSLTYKRRCPTLSSSESKFLSKEIKYKQEAQYPVVDFRGMDFPQV